MRYVIDPEERNITVIGARSAADIVRANLFVDDFKKKFGRFTVSVNYKPSEVAFKPAKFPDPNMDKGPQA